MPDTKITALAAITTVDPAADVLPIVDISDTSMAASGTTKKITSNQILGAGGTATLASATISGDLTVDTNVLKVNTTSNRVGVGTTNLFKPLTVEAGSTGAGTINQGLVINSSAAYGVGQGVSYSSLSFSRNRATDTSALYASAEIYGGNFLETSSDGGFLGFRTQNSAGTLLDRYTIDRDGTSTWSVGGSTAMTLNATGLGVGVVPNQKFVCAGPRSYFAGGGAVYGIGIGFNTTRTAADHVFFLGATDSATPDLVFSGASGAALMRLDAAGNLGIGVTPSAWGLAGYKGLEIGVLGNGVFSGNGDLNISSNAYYASGSWKYAVSTVAATSYQQNAGQHIFKTAASGTAGTTITDFATAKMTLDVNGNLILLSSNTPATLTTNGQLTVNATSNTNLRFSYRGSDGVTRVADITLA